MQDKGPDTLNPDLAYGDHVLALERRSVADVREIVRPDVESDRRFAAVARISEINLSLYRNFVQPWVQAAVTPQSASLATCHPLRVTYELASDRNPCMGWIAGEAQKVREDRKPVSPDNPFLREQEKFSQMSKRRSINGVNGVTACMSRRSMPCTDPPPVQAWAGMDASDTGEHAGIPATHPSIERSGRRKRNVCAARSPRVA